MDFFLFILKLQTMIRVVSIKIKPLKILQKQKRNWKFLRTPFSNALRIEYNTKKLLLECQVISFFFFCYTILGVHVLCYENHIKCNIIILKSNAISFWAQWKKYAINLCFPLNTYDNDNDDDSVKLLCERNEIITFDIEIFLFCCILLS